MPVDVGADEHDHRSSLEYQDLARILFVVLAAALAVCVPNRRIRLQRCVAVRNTVTGVTELNVISNR